MTESETLAYCDACGFAISVNVSVDLYADAIEYHLDSLCEKGFEFSSIEPEEISIQAGVCNSHFYLLLDSELKTDIVGSNRSCSVSNCVEPITTKGFIRVKP